MLYKTVIRPFLFLFKPEFVHEIVVSGLKMVIRNTVWLRLIAKVYKVEHPCLEREILGLKFKNPVGVAAGLDKDAEIFEALGAFGFSHIEIGTVTPKSQSGNPKIRLYRIVQDGALINRMGFNNKGVENTIRNLRNKRSDIIIGGNIGKNKIIDNKEAVNDYKMCFNSLFPYVNYFALNISSPNTPNLRDLQSREPLKELLSELKILNSGKESPKPIFVKIAPDLTFNQLDELVELVQEIGIDGIIATNTTVSRDGLSIDNALIQSIGCGGLSGNPLRNKSTEIIRYIHAKTGGKLPIIGIGGIMSVNDALEKLKAGASLIQLYTGFIYNGPRLVSRINKRIIKEFKEEYCA
jgi:dihydroorotate dehydrogenase